MAKMPLNKLGQLYLKAVIRSTIFLQVMENLENFKEHQALLGAYEKLQKAKRENWNN